MVSPNEPRGLLIWGHMAVVGIATVIVAIPTEEQSMLMQRCGYVLHLDAPKFECFVNNCHHFPQSENKSSHPPFILNNLKKPWFNRGWN